MTLTQKETGLLKELAGQETLCRDKYNKYSKEACSAELKELFSQMATCEQNHLNTINAMLSGTVPKAPTGLSGENNSLCKKVCYNDESSRNIDKFLLSDMLAMEKHASSLYDTSVFEFCDPSARKMLNHIQSEEQQHGEKIYAFMSANGFYQG